MINNADEISPLTHERKMIAYGFNGKGQGKNLGGDSPLKKGQGSGFNWYYLHRDDALTMGRLGELELDGFVKEALMAEDTRPRFSVHGKGAILILRGVNLNEGAEPDDMVSLRFWIEKNLVIGIWLRRAFAVRDVMASIDRGNVTPSPSDLMCKIAFRLADRAEPIIANLSDIMDDLEEQGETGSYSKTQKALVEVRQSSNALRRFMVPQRDALTTFAIEDFDWLATSEQSRLREAAERITRLGEELESVRERAMIAHDQILSERSDKMNRTMLVLTILSSIFMPLGLLTGLLGINVGGIPGTDNPNAFWIVCGFLLILGCVLWLLVRISRIAD